MRGRAQSTTVTSPVQSHLHGEGTRGAPMSRSISEIGKAGVSGQERVEDEDGGGDEGPEERRLRRRLDCRLK